MNSKQITALVVALVVLVTTSASEETGTTVISGLNGPMGVLVAGDGHVLVIDTGIGGDDMLMLPHPLSGQTVGYGTGNSAQIIQLDSEGEQTKIASLP